MTPGRGFEEILDARLRSLQDEPAVSWRPAFSGTRPLSPSDFELGTTARIAHAFSGAVFGAAAGASRDSKPTNAAVRRCRILTADQREALATLRALGALELRPDSDETELRRAYRRLARQFHPDSDPRLTETERRQAATKFAAATAAYRFLLGHLA